MSSNYSFSDEEDKRRNPKKGKMSSGKRNALNPLNIKIKHFQPTREYLEDQYKWSLELQHELELKLIEESKQENKVIDSEEEEE